MAGAGDYVCLHFVSDTDEVNFADCSNRATRLLLIATSCSDGCLQMRNARRQRREEERIAANEEENAYA
jgi:hypothetical protein